MKKQYLCIMLAAVCLLLVGVTKVSAANWQLASESKAMLRYVDTEAVRKTDDNMTFWHKVLIKSSGESEICQIETAFSQGKLMARNLQCSVYDTNGRMKSEYPAEQWTEVIRGSTWATVIRFASEYARY